MSGQDAFLFEAVDFGGQQNRELRPATEVRGIDILASPYIQLSKEESTDTIPIDFHIFLLTEAVDLFVQLRMGATTIFVSQ